MKSSKSSKFYVVFVGRQPGVYGSWEECESQILGYKGNKHLSFRSLEEAHVAWMRYCEKENGFESKPYFKSPNQVPSNSAHGSSSCTHPVSPYPEDTCKFAADSNDAREDVAVEVLRTLLALSELHAENAFLTQQVLELRTRLGDV
ncbi:Ribosomal protein L9/RNase H1, N-terminal [Sesbania bispinosa]|nr:Ribosomal protein L9/RNase H1, N-terminal [Sesbania bispinosa]